MIEDNLTSVANRRGGVRLVKTERLVGRKYAVKFTEGAEIWVSPAVFELAETDMSTLKDVLRVVELPGRGWSDEKMVKV